jgi:hypothetical protein
MRSVAVVVVDVRMDDGFEMSTTGDEHPVQTFTPDCPDEALSQGVGTRSFDWRSNDVDTFCPEDLVEAGGELGVAIRDQELDRLQALGQFEAQALRSGNQPAESDQERSVRRVQSRSDDLATEDGTSCRSMTTSTARSDLSDRRRQRISVVRRKARQRNERATDHSRRHDHSGESPRSKSPDEVWAPTRQATRPWPSLVSGVDS